MLDTRESIVNFIERSGHKQGLRLLKIEKRFGIEFNILQFQQVINRAYGKTYLSYAIALDEALETDMTVSEGLIQTLDMDVGFSKRRLKGWFGGFISFADKQGYEVIRTDEFSVKVKVK